MSEKFERKNGGLPFGFKFIHQLFSEKKLNEKECNYLWIICKMIHN